MDLSRFRSSVASTATGEATSPEPSPSNLRLAREQIDTLGRTLQETRDQLTEQRAERSAEADAYGQLLGRVSELEIALRAAAACAEASEQRLRAAEEARGASEQQLLAAEEARKEAAASASSERAEKLRLAGEAKAAAASASSEQAERQRLVDEVKAARAALDDRHAAAEIALRSQARARTHEEQLKAELEEGFSVVSRLEAEKAEVERALAKSEEALASARAHAAQQAASARSVRDELAAVRAERDRAGPPGSPADAADGPDLEFVEIMDEDARPSDPVQEASALESAPAVVAPSAAVAPRPSPAELDARLEALEPPMASGDWAQVARLLGPAEEAAQLPPALGLIYALAHKESEAAGLISGGENDLAIRCVTGLLGVRTKSDVALVVAKRILRKNPVAWQRMPAPTTSVSIILMVVGLVAGLLVGGLVSFGYVQFRFDHWPHF